MNEYEELAHRGQRMLASIDRDLRYQFDVDLARELVKAVAVLGKLSSLHEGTCVEASGWAEYDLRFVRRFPDQCTEAVSRKGEEQPCDKPAVAVRIDPEEGDPYPVCAYHARADMVSLRVLMEGGR